MAYNDFAYFYDELNGEADYDKLYQFIVEKLKSHNITEGIVTDLGCGTGELTIMLAQSGYDMIGIDQSEEMLSVVRDKAEQLDLLDNIMLLQQDIVTMDLYGTIQAAVSSFDTYNHISPEKFSQAIARAGFFMEKDGLFIFDMNTLYKHKEVLGNNRFEIETPELKCTWVNRYTPLNHRIDMLLTIENTVDDEIYCDEITEYAYDLEYIDMVLKNNGFDLIEVKDGETFEDLRDTSNRAIFVAKKRYTQTEGQTK